MWIQVEDVNLKEYVLVNLDKVSLIMPNKDDGYVDIILDNDVHIFAKPVFINDRGRRCPTYSALCSFLTKSDTRFC